MESHHLILFSCPTRMDYYSWLPYATIHARTVAPNAYSSIRCESIKLFGLFAPFAVVLLPEAILYFLLLHTILFGHIFCKFNLHNAKRQWSPLLFAFAQGALLPCVPIHRITLFGYSIHMNDFWPISGCILSFTPNNSLFGRVQPVASSC